MDKQRQPAVCFPFPFPFPFLFLMTVCLITFIVGYASMGCAGLDSRSENLTDSDSDSAPAPGSETGEIEDRKDGDDMLNKEQLFAHEKEKPEFDQNIPAELMTATLAMG